MEKEIIDYFNVSSVVATFIYKFTDTGNIEYQFIY